MSLKTAVFKSSTPHPSAFCVFVAQADPDSVYRALNAFGCHWKKEETRPLNPEAPLQEQGKTVVFKPANFRAFQNVADTLSRGQVARASLSTADRALTGRRLVFGRLFVWW